MCCLNRPTWKEIKEIHTRWFSKEAMDFFQSIVYSASRTDYKNGYLFVTSEQREGHPRLYSIRYADRATIETIGEFQGYKSLDEAVVAIDRLEAEDVCCTPSN